MYDLLKCTLVQSLEHSQCSIDLENLKFPLDASSPLSLGELILVYLHLRLTLRMTMVHIETVFLNAANKQVETSFFENFIFYVFVRQIVLFTGGGMH